MVVMVTWVCEKIRGERGTETVIVILLFQDVMSKGHRLPGSEYVARGVSLREMSPKQQHKLHQSKSGPVVNGILL